MKCINYDLGLLLEMIQRKLYICQYLVIYHELKNLLNYGFRRLMCELMYYSINIFIVKMMIYMSKIIEGGILYSVKRKNNE